MARSLRSFSVIVERIQSPWTQPFGRWDLDEDPPRLDGLPFACPVAVAFFARSRAAVFSFTIIAGEALERWIRWRWEQALWAEAEREERRMGRHCSKTLPRRFI